jgi:hypothetical protein
MTLLDGQYSDGMPDKYLARWFAPTGAVGFFTAISLDTVMAHHCHFLPIISLNWFLVFCPALLVNLFDIGWVRPLGWRIIEDLVIYGSNFLLYAFVGLSFGWLSNQMKQRFSKPEVQSPGQ